MPLNPSRGMMYPDEICNFTWNPFKGKCSHDCIYCYMKFGKRADIAAYHEPVRLYEKELTVKFPPGSRTFVCSGCDICDPAIDDYDISRVLGYCSMYPASFLLQSKNPQRFRRFSGEYPESSIFGTTIETDDLEVYKGISRAPDPIERAKAMVSMSDMFHRRFVTVEPVMKFNRENLLELLKKVDPEFVAIGADSCNTIPDEKEPSMHSVFNLVYDLSASGIKVYVKENVINLPGKKEENLHYIGMFRRLGVLHERKKGKEEKTESQMNLI